MKKTCKGCNQSFHKNKGYAINGRVYCSADCADMIENAKDKNPILTELKGGKMKKLCSMCLNGETEYPAEYKVTGYGFSDHSTITAHPFKLYLCEEHVEIIAGLNKENPFKTQIKL